MRPKLWPASNHRLTLQNPEGPDIFHSLWTSLHAARSYDEVLAKYALQDGPDNQTVIKPAIEAEVGESGVLKRVETGASGP